MPQLDQCVITPIQFINYQKVILDKGAIIIMQIKEIAKWSNRTHLVTGKFTLFRTTKDFMRAYINLVTMVMYKQNWTKIELTNGGPPRAKAGCPVRGLLLGCDIS